MKSRSELGWCPLRRPALDDELAFFIAARLIQLPLAYRKGMHLTVFLLFHVPCYVGTGLVSIM